LTNVALDDNEWQQVLAILATAPWRDANPLLMKIGNQLRQHHNPAATTASKPISTDGNGQEVHHE
jgi:hypothetical protein